MKTKIIKLLIELKTENKKREKFLKKNKNSSCLMQPCITMTIQKEYCKTIISKLENMF